LVFVFVFVFDVGCGGGIGDEKDGGVGVDPVGGDGEIVGGKGGAEDVGEEGEAEKGREAEEDDDFGGGVRVWVVVGVVEPRWRGHSVFFATQSSKETHLFICVFERQRVENNRNLDGRGNKQRLVGANGFGSSFHSLKSNVFLVLCSRLHHAPHHRKSSSSFLHFSILFFLFILI